MIIIVILIAIAIVIAIVVQLTGNALIGVFQLRIVEQEPVHLRIAVIKISLLNLNLA